MNQMLQNSEVEFLISNMLHPRAVCLDLEDVGNKHELICYLAGLLLEVGKINSMDRFVEAVYQREKMGPTFASEGIAFPHGESAAVNGAGIAIGRSENGIFYETEEGGGLINIVVLFAVPVIKKSVEQEGFQVLARLLVRKDFREALHRAAKFEDVTSAIRQYGALLD